MGWNQFDLKTPLERHLGLPVDLENAANACALAELWSNRQLDGIRNLVAVTVSDDISVGMIINGQLLRGSSGMAGEFGHVSQMDGGPRCRCGNTGCWEVLASNAAALRYYGELASFRKNGSSSRDHTSKLSFGDLLQLAEYGDMYALKALNQMGHYLGAGIAMLVMGLEPEALVVVGEVTRAWNKIKPAVIKTIRNRTFKHARTRILATDPETRPQLRGAMALVFQKHFCTPLIGQ